MAELPRPILLYDGVCGLCHRLVQFIIHRDRRAIFRFASLQSPLAAGILGRHGANPTGLDTVIFVLKQLPVPWPAAAFLLGLLPGFIRDLAYDVVARQRYRLFGRSEICMLPSDQDHSRFLDV